MLVMYAECFRKTSLTEEYVQVGLKVIARFVRGKLESFQGLRKGSELSINLKKISSASNSLEQTVLVPMDDYFDSVIADPFIQHFDDRDGFKILLRFKNLMLETFEAHEIKMRIVGVGENQNSELWLATKSVHLVKSGFATVLLEANVSSMPLHNFFSFTDPFRR